MRRPGGRGLAALALVAFAGPGVHASDANAYLNDALTFIESNALHRRDVDWALLRLQVEAMIGTPRTPRETYPAIRLALEQLGDRHSRLLEPGEASLLRAGRAPGHTGLRTLDPERVVVQVYSGGAAARAGVRVGDVLEAGEPTGTAGTVELTLRRPGQVARRVLLERGEVDLNETPRGWRLPGGLGYLGLPGHAGTRQESLDAYATRAQSLLREHAAGTCGWVVDLRRNSGGNMWPMLAAAGPFLGEGVVGYFVSDRGRWAWHYGRGQAGLADGSVSARAHTTSVPDLSRAPVAVLTSRLTGSSGEGVLIAFRGRTATRVFGEATFGVPTANTVRRLADGARIILTVAHNADRSGKPYAASLPPDEHVAVDWTRLGAHDDPVLVAASAWLRAQPACTRPPAAAPVRVAGPGAGPSL